jgi:uroporphyrinogen-III decarboxylase
MAREWGERIAFVGGLDARVLESGDREGIERAVRDLVEGMKGLGAGYVFGSDHSLSTNVDYGDFCRAVEVYRRHARY